MIIAGISTIGIGRWAGRLFVAKRTSRKAWPEQTATSIIELVARVLISPESWLHAAVSAFRGLVLARDAPLGREQRSAHGGPDWSGLPMSF